MAVFGLKFGIADIVIQILLLILLSKVHIHPTIRLDFNVHCLGLFVIKKLLSKYNNLLYQQKIKPGNIALGRNIT